MEHFDLMYGSYCIVLPHVDQATQRDNPFSLVPPYLWFKASQPLVFQRPKYERTIAARYDHDRKVQYRWLGGWLHLELHFVIILLPS